MITQKGRKVEKKSLSAIRIYLVVLLKSTSSIKNYFEEK